MLQPRDLKGRQAISYARWSSGKQSQGDSLARQTSNAEAFCSQYGLTLDRDRQLVDDGVSAFKGANLEASLGAFVADVRSGKIPSDVVLIVENIDRITRVKPARAIRYFLDLLDTGLTLVTLTDQRVHTSEGYDDNFAGLMMSLMAMQAAHEYSAKLSYRVREAWGRKADRAKAGRIKLAKVPFWIDHETQQLNSRAADARLLFDLAKQGLGQLAITQTLNAKGIASPLGGTWSQVVVGETLRNPAAYGTLVLRGEEVRDYFPALITETEWLASRQRTKARQHSRQVGNTANLFSRLVYCSHCGSSMALTSVKRRDTSFGYLTCTGKMSKRTDCKAPNWKYGEFEREMLDRVGFLAVPIPQQPEAFDGPLVALEDAVATLEAKQANILAGVADASSADVIRMLTAQADGISREIALKRREIERVRENSARFREVDASLADLVADQDEMHRLAREDRKAAQGLLGDLIERIDLESDSKGLRRALVTMRGFPTHTTIIDSTGARVTVVVRPTHAIVFDSTGEPG
ncbi:recombinase family protein [Mesorhizobium sp. VK23B]|uniref:Recombinase family protein n=1 Tax=Mesorhizobium dulcispinae TaxID=3072316 RepID=A0ABU4XQ18_9HYPH|nr:MULTISPECIES: recombinase family protein [unclassified Mesorhizobium]MDX8469223.1 recombinase family protein [Mesorhizobium sp. VK23B]MDX8475644.1 recombinase family protein [Mesorhizobium sp. VK23A]